MQQVFLSGKNGSIIGNYALVDDVDFERVCQYKWTVLRKKSENTSYAQVFINKKSHLLHRMILNETNPKQQIDHVNGNGLDNQSHNLRRATPSQNGANRSSKKKYKGISTTTMSGRIYYRAELKKDGIKYRRKCKSEIEAALAYNEMAVKYHGEFARLNIIP